jgi:hypothetical protein
MDRMVGRSHMANPAMYAPPGGGKGCWGGRPSSYRSPSCSSQGLGTGIKGSQFHQVERSQVFEAPMVFFAFLSEKVSSPENWITQSPKKNQILTKNELLRL